MAEAVATVLETIRQNGRITIYGDFDCDGVCATAILVGAIRDLGGTCDWFIPDRIADGYGLNPGAIRTIHGRGTNLVITVDSGVTAVAEVELASELGMKVLVTDHHQADERLPDCPVLHPVISGYPFPHLCGAGVAAKLASALRRETGRDEGDESDLDLVALATVADVMPLIGENRTLVREGLKVARRARRPGMAALMTEARVEPSRLDSQDFGFRLGPRINAAGRMFRADAGVELLLAESAERAAEIARELSAANSERRRVEREVESAARKELGQLDPGAAIVVAGNGWHPGVVGIVASKLARSEGRPAVVISLDGERGRGSGRSVPGLDLHSCLGENSELLEAFGGHAAAAGLTIMTDRIDEFRQSLAATVESRIGSDPAEPVLEFDAVAGGLELGLELAEEIEQLQPFGAANPPIRLLIPGARIEGLSEMGEGRHCRFSICSGGHRSRGVAFGRSDLGITGDGRADLVAELGINHWNGSIESRLQVIDVLPVPEATALDSCGDSEWWQRFEAALHEPLDSTAISPEVTLPVFAGTQGPPGIALAELISAGDRVAILTADARQRWQALDGEALRRFIPGKPASPELPAAAVALWAGSPASDLAPAAAAQVLLTDYSTLDRAPAGLLAGFDRVALLDPPFRAGSVTRLIESQLPIHLLAGPEETGFASRVASHQHDLTIQLRELFKGLRDGGTEGGKLDGTGLRLVLETDGPGLRSPEQAAHLLRVLIETGHARSEGEAGARRAGVVSSEKTPLTASAVFVHYFELHKEQERFLSQFNRPDRTT